jgi:lipopolysaccharide export system protein LptA
MAAALALLAGAATAQQGAESTTVADGKSGKSSARKQADELRPTGPVTVKADSAEWVQDNQMKYVGNVSMTSNTMTVRGDSMEVHQAPDGEFEAWVHGKPATLDHAADPTADGAASKPLHAEAREIHYDSRAGKADLTGAAHVTRGDDEVNGETIGYIVPERRIQAASGGKSQVTITFQPPQTNKDASAPADEKTPAVQGHPGKTP